MITNFITDTTSNVMAKCLDGLGARQKVIADNIANVETPGFTRSDVDFESQLKQALECGSESMLENASPEVKADNISPSRPDGNNVSIDKEMADMSKNTMQYEALVQLMSLKSSMIRTAINEGKR